MDQILSILSWVDIHGIYYIVKNGDQIWCFFKNKIYRF